MKTHIKAIIAALAITAGTAFAAVPTGTPVFTNPTNINNQFYPFTPGAYRLYIGASEGVPTAAVYVCTDETRTFVFNGQNVVTRVLREINYERGKLIEFTDNFFAQADDGTVYYFGETVYNYDEDGNIADNHGSWLVNGPTLPTDPASTATAGAPTIYMPANPEVGDVFFPEDTLPFVHERDQVKKTGKVVVARGTKYRDCMQIEESSQISTGKELKWWARGVGVIRTQGINEHSQLAASSFRQP